MDQVACPSGRGDAARPATPSPSGHRTPDQLLRDALAIRALLADLRDDEHALRSRLLLARDRLRREAARQWREHGWRPITDDR